MGYYERYEDPILQSEKFNMSAGTVVRIQIKEDSYVVTFDLDTEMYKNLRLNTFKKGLRITSHLKRFPEQKISKKIKLTRKFTDLSQLSEDIIKVEDKYYSMNVEVKFSDFMRADVRKSLKNAIIEKQELVSV